MRITQESDYALKIVTALASHSALVDAKSLSEETAVTLRFTLKILHKLVLGGFVSSFKGSKGGYILAKDPNEITLKNIIELIDGPIFIARCLENGENCALNHNKRDCIYHHIFDSISFEVAQKLDKVSIGDVLSGKYSFN